MFIAISGISGSGKSTIGKELSKRLGMSYLDLDDFYLPKKPIVTLSNGVSVKNWDCLEALDIDAVKNNIKNKLDEGNGLIFTGFTIRDSLLPIKPTFHIHLSISNNAEEIINRCIIARKQSKGNIYNDDIVVKELVYPFYLETLSKSTITHKVEVYNEYNYRKSVDDLVHEISHLVYKYYCSL